MASGPALPGLSLAPLLHQLRPQRPDALIALPMWQAIEIASSRLPPTSEFGFECHLLTGGQRADLVTRVRRSDGSASILACRTPSDPEAGDFWSPAIELCSRWCSPGAAPGFAFEAFWLEFDAKDLQSRFPQPGIAFLYVAAAAQRSLDATIADAIERTLPILAGRSLDDRLADAIAVCVGAVTPRSALSHFGVALARGGSEIRVCFRLPLGAIAPNLAALGLGSMAHLVADILAPLDDSCRVTLQIALTPAVAPRLGLEISSASPVGWKTILACLLARNLCTQQEASAIVRWTSDAGSNGLPAPRVEADRLPDDPNTFAKATLWRVPSHIKITVSADHQISAKAYLFAGAAWPATVD